MVRPKEFDRDTALRKAMEVFWTKGYDGTSISDLTETMEISRSSLYETFGDKRELFLEALQHYLEFTTGKLGLIFGETDSVKQGMSEFLHGAINFVLNENLPGGCFLTNTITALGTLDEHFQAVLKLYLEKQEEEFSVFLEHGKQRGEISPDKDTRALARFFVGLVRGVTVIARLHKDRQVLEDIVAVGLKVLD